MTEETIAKHAASGPTDDHKVFVCGLPGVYAKLCGGRQTKEVTAGSALHNLGYSERHVVKF